MPYKNHFAKGISKNIPQKYMSYQNISQECPTKEFCKSIPKESQRYLFSKNISPIIYHTNIIQEYLCKNISQE